MTLDEVIDLLTVAAVFDFRSIGEADAIAWHAVLGDLDFGDARTAVLAHYTESCDRIMPANVRQRVKAMRRERLAREIAPAPAAGVADDPGQYRAALRAGLARIADGKRVPAAIAAPVREDPPPLAFTAAREGLGAGLPRSLQELARRQAAESRAAREAADRLPETGEPA